MYDTGSRHRYRSGIPFAHTFETPGWWKAQESPSMVSEVEDVSSLVSPPTSPAPPSTDDIFGPLAAALARCLAVVFVGFVAQHASIFSASEVAGISAFVARVALPAMVLLSIATLDVNNLDARLVCAILAGKCVLFAFVVTACALANAKEWGAGGDPEDADVDVARGINARTASLLANQAPTGMCECAPCSSLPGSIVDASGARGCDDALDVPRLAGGAPAAAARLRRRPPASVSTCVRPADAHSPDVRGAWRRRAGLYAIFATQSNDFALGLPLIDAIWGSKFTSTVFIVGPMQLAVLNPVAFALMESAAVAPTSSRAPQRPTRRGQALRKVVRSPVVVATMCGAVLRGLLLLADASLPPILCETLGSLSATFTGSALITLGLSLRTRLSVLEGTATRITALCLLLSKVLVAPLLMRIFVAWFVEPSADEADVQATFSFAFIYGMLPAAPTVVVFAREYGEPSELLAALQLLCLLLSAPFLLVTTLAIESPTDVQPAAMLELSYWLAILGAVLSLSLASFLIATPLLRRPAIAAGAWGEMARHEDALSTPPRAWLLGVALAALAYNGAEVAGRYTGGCSSPTLSAWLRALSDWSLCAMRAQLACVALLMAHQACPERARDSLTPTGSRRLRMWQLGGAFFSFVLPALMEMSALIARAPPSRHASKSHPGEWLCGDESSVLMRVWRVAFTTATGLVIAASLTVMYLAPAPVASTCVAPLRADPTGRAGWGDEANERAPRDGAHDITSSADTRDASEHVDCAARRVGSDGHRCASHGDRSDHAAANVAAHEGGAPAGRPSAGSLNSIDGSSSTDSLDTFDVPMAPTLLAMPHADGAQERLPASPALSVQPLPPLPQQQRPQHAPPPPQQPQLPQLSPPRAPSSASLASGGPALPGRVSRGVTSSAASGSPARVGGGPHSRSNRLLRRLVEASAERLLRLPLEPSESFDNPSRSLPLIRRWQSRLVLLMLYASLSMIVSVATITESFTHFYDGVWLELIIIDRTLIFCHGVSLALLFGFSSEVVGPVSSKLRRWLAACLVGNEEAPITAFPRAESGIWG